jgi:hypothetical protein
MTLQIAFSGTTRPGRTLRFPTFPEQRFMAYDAVIHGVRGLIYFGGSLTPSLNPRDARLGWNWTFWDHVQKRLVLELGDRSPIRAALTAPDAPLGVGNGDPAEIEFLARADGADLYVLAANWSPSKTLRTGFTGLPAGLSTGVVVFEEPRTVTVREGTFQDWFAPYEFTFTSWHTYL